MGVMKDGIRPGRTVTEQSGSSRQFSASSFVCWHFCWHFALQTRFMQEETLEIQRLPGMAPEVGFGAATLWV
jgi:hypothetical protein